MFIQNVRAQLKIFTLPWPLREKAVLLYKRRVEGEERSLMIPSPTRLITS